MRLGAMLPLALLLGTGCTDLVTIDVGRDRIAPIVFERQLSVGGGPAFGCPTLEREFSPEGARSGFAAMAPVTEGCTARVVLEGAEIADRNEIITIAETLDGFDTTALVGIDVVVDELTLTGDGVALGSDSLTEVELLLDGTTVLHGPDPASVLGSRAAVPETVVDAMLEAVADRAPLLVDVEMRATFEDAFVPEGLHVRTVLQPILRVDIVRALL